MYFLPNRIDPTKWCLPCETFKVQPNGSIKYISNDRSFPTFLPGNIYLINPVRPIPSHLMRPVPPHLMTPTTQSNSPATPSQQSSQQPSQLLSVDCNGTIVHLIPVSSSGGQLYAIKFNCPKFIEAN